MSIGRIIVVIAAIWSLQPRMVLAFSEDSGGVAPTPPKKIELIVNARQSVPQPGAGEAVAGQAIRLFTPATVAQALPRARHLFRSESC